MDIFDAKISCSKCDVPMEKIEIHRNGFELRAVKCSKCGQEIVHPGDMEAMDHYKDLKGKTFRVKLRMVGNSHAISIPKEIVSFINEMNRQMDKDMNDMVRLCFEDFDRLSVQFGEDQRGGFR